MLAHSDGASLDELISATGWLPHSTRAVLSRLRKGGYQIDRRRQDGSTIYYLMFNPNTLPA
jgi:biotin operon repressor